MIPALVLSNGTQKAKEKEEEKRKNKKTKKTTEKKGDDTGKNKNRNKSGVSALHLQCYGQTSRGPAGLHQCQSSRHCRPA